MVDTLIKEESALQKKLAKSIQENNKRERGLKLVQITPRFAILIKNPTKEKIKEHLERMGKYEYGMEVTIGLKKMVI